MCLVHVQNLEYFPPVLVRELVELGQAVEAKRDVVVVWAGSFFVLLDLLEAFCLFDLRT